jgi:hypothetical protein
MSKKIAITGSPALLSIAIESGRKMPLVKANGKGNGPSPSIFQELIRAV